MVRRMPRTVARTASELVGGSCSASLWKQAIAAVRRPMVDAFRPLSAWKLRNRAAVPGVAGIASSPHASQKAENARQSLP
jgi:hypothetical protein